MGLGYQGLGGAWGRVLNGTVDSRVASLYSVRGARFGLEWNWSSHGMEAYPEESWNHTTGRFLLGYARTLVRGIRPYGEVALTFRRMHPEGSRFFSDELPREYPEDFHVEGWGLDGALGVELRLDRRTALDVSGGYGRFSTDPDLSSRGLGAVSDGSSWRAGLGLTWYPNHDRNPRARNASDGRLDPGDSRTSETSAGPDAWGVEHSRGLSIGAAAVVGLMAPWTWNMLLQDQPWTYVSPRSWWKGVTQGFAWDDNRFSVNHFRHPYHGHLYFSSARSNGFGYWDGALYATVGSYLWECCTETHVASIPDMVTTSLGGAAVGETLYRASSLALDNTAVGSERFLREAMGAILNPPRGLVRLLTGRAWRAGSNPSNALDHVPEPATSIEGHLKKGTSCCPSSGSTSPREISSGDEPSRSTTIALASISRPVTGSCWEESKSEGASGAVRPRDPSGPVPGS